MPDSIPEELAALQAEVTNLQGRVSALEAAIPPATDVATRLPWADPNDPPQPPEEP